MFFNFDSIDKAFRFIRIIENNVRIMLVKDISLSKNGEARLSVETYYMPVK
jgi:hypothetical protein